jgi:glycerophosphoryl diester phosphodiesterase
MTTMNKLILALAAAAAGFGTSARADALPQLGGQIPLVLAHRGTTGYLPEHTLGGYELAVRFGVDYIEPDLQLTSDGVLVAMHDDTLTRTTNVQQVFPGRASYAVSAFTLAEIKQLTVKPVGTASTSYPGFAPSMVNPFKVPTFQEVIDLARQQSAVSGREIGIYPEAKQADPVMEDLILSTLVANGYNGSNKVFIQSFSIDTIRSISQKQAALGQNFKLIVLSSSSTALVNYGLDDINDFAYGVGVSITGAGIGQSFIGAAHGANLAVHGYTFNKPGSNPTAVSDFLQFFNWGMDGVFSNYADVAMEARAQFLATQVPEPATWGLMGAGLLGVAAVRRRRMAAD